MAKVHLTDDAKEDLRDLDGSAKKIVLKAILKLEDQPELRGQPLGSKKTGNLTGLRKLVVGDRDWRIVYRVEDDGSVCVVWVIGKRADDEVYEIAMARLKMQTDMPLKEQITEVITMAFKSP
ncbi:addiction module toxin, RelE/StbE family [Arthrobacter sp. FB24]|uniref:type II toxin-antitoxin system RelE family toxin n=1 Tax=Arthrobacter sp. (strain FB24) TaxID=290399 RepID=UPI000052730B|nr:type II toxin-antitoxin system RelE/ParE family toxin [Arthrobacter sp. FB24]ABK02751.1 addiction module toxin, RelE/StbE family [Arthrobacter sp. FB24]